MKKAIVFMSCLIALLAVSQTTYAISTLSLEKTVEGKGTTYDNYNYVSHTGDIDAYVINLTYTKKFKIDIAYQAGEFRYYIGSPTLECWEIQAGYPIINQPKGVAYLTVGGMTYSEYSQSKETPKHDANGGMLGVDFVSIPNERFQFELNLQRSFLGGSSRLYYWNGFENASINSSLDLTIYKIKIQYFFTDNFGFTINYRSMDYNVKDPFNDAVDLSTTSMGLIYRF